MCTITIISWTYKSVSHVVMNETRHQIISLGFDKVIKIWDTRTFRCLQTLHDTVGYQPDNRISALLFDNDNKRLITFTCYGRGPLDPN